MLERRGTYIGSYAEKNSFLCSRQEQATLESRARSACEPAHTSNISCTLHCDNHVCKCTCAVTLQPYP